jgi:hypothetical protein
MRTAMDHWLNKPGLIFLKELSTWFILNHKCEPVIWIEGESELGWYFACVECGANDRTKLPVVKKFQRPEAPPKILRAERRNVIGN